MSRLPRGADLLLDLELDRQAVAVPAALPRHEVAGHRLEPRVDVLERARLDVVHARACRSPSAAPRRRSTRARPRAGRASGGTRRPPARTRGSAPRAPGSSPSDRPVRTPPSVPPPRLRPHDERPVPAAGTRRGPRGTTPLAAASRAATTHGRARRPPAITGGTRLRLLRSGRAPVRAAARGGCPRRGSPPGSHRPRLAPAAPIPAARSRRRLCRACYTLR